MPLRPEQGERPEYPVRAERPVRAARPGRAQDGARAFSEGQAETDVADGGGENAVEGFTPIRVTRTTPVDGAG